MHLPPGSSQYELEIVYRGDPDSAKNAILQEPDEVQRWVEERIEPNSVLTAANMRGASDLGNFLIFNNIDGVAHVRLLEHQGFYAKRTTAISTNKTVVFTSDVGSTFSVDENSTVPISAALEAFGHWLRTGKADPKLSWGEE
jgi:hypothetical protein